jgi:hypothetical protein
MLNKDWLQCLMNVFEYFIFIKIIPHHTTCFHYISKTLSCKQIKTCNISTTFYTKK